MEQEALSCGVIMKKFHSDNGIFKSRDFEQALLDGSQSLTKSGVGAHHQNGRAERGIQTVQNMARSMLLHSAINWSEFYDKALWPYALTHATYIHNHLPQEELGWLAPMEIFCSTYISCTNLRRLRVWGCPVFVLDPRLQDYQKIPKWEPRAQLGQNLGVSEKHSSSINLVRNVQTERITPQFHMVFDELFSTVDQKKIDDLDIFWEELYTNSRENLMDEFQGEFINEDIPRLHNDWLPIEERVEIRHQHPRRQIINYDSEDESQQLGRVPSPPNQTQQGVISPAGRVDVPTPHDVIPQAGRVPYV